MNDKDKMELAIQDLCTRNHAGERLIGSIVMQSIRFCQDEEKFWNILRTVTDELREGIDQVEMRWMRLIPQ